MRKSVWFIVSLSVFVLLGGCEKTREMLGQGKQAPDEFAVYSRAPLSLPPSYGLKAPKPGTTRPQGVDPQSRAERIVSGLSGRRPTTGAKPKGTPSMSPGLNALLQETGALDADPDIRSIVNRETTILTEEDKTVTERIMFWNTPTEYGTIIDPESETKRIHENQALGRTISEGETPTIERKRKAILEGIFD